MILTRFRATREVDGVLDLLQTLPLEDRELLLSGLNVFKPRAQEWLDEVKVSAHLQSIKSNIFPHLR